LGVEADLDSNTEDNLDLSNKVTKIDRRQLLRGDFSSKEVPLSPPKSLDLSR